MPQFIVSYSPTRDGFTPETLTELEQEKISAHWDYIKAAFDAGSVIFVGRTTEAPFIGACVLEAADQTAAKDFMSNDPTVLSGVFNGTVQPFATLLVRHSE